MPPPPEPVVIDASLGQRWFAIGVATLVPLALVGFSVVMGDIAGLAFGVVSGVIFGVACRRAVRVRVVANATGLEVRNTAMSYRLSWVDVDSIKVHGAPFNFAGLLYRWYWGSHISLQTTRAVGRIDLQATFDLAFSKARNRRLAERLETLRAAARPTN
jgi:hypothetical protein